jgi:phosphate transport system substrate-binding protein
MICPLRIALASALFASIVSSLVNAAPPFTGAGSTAAQPIYKIWAENYLRVSQAALNYDAVGSGAGLARIRARTVDFGASDFAPDPLDMDKDGLIAVPTVVTAVVPVINVAGVGRGQLRLSGEVLAKIFLGQVSNWNAAEIRELNSGVQLPSVPIRAVVRADGSGTTYHFTEYLAKVSAEWASTRGVKLQFEWPTRFIQAKGSGGVSKAVRSTPGAIGYIDYNYVLDDGLDYAQVRNADGAFMTPTPESFAAAVRRSDWYSGGDFSQSIANMSGAASWPITMGTYVLFPRVSKSPDGTLAALRFVTWGWLNGDDLARVAKFVPLPDRVQAKAYAEIAKVVDDKGNLLGVQALSLNTSGR